MNIKSYHVSGCHGLLGPEQQLHKFAQFFRVACLQKETAPEKLLNRCEKRFEKREKGSENDPKRVWKHFSPSQAA